jgi:hypothetical protein
MTVDAIRTSENIPIADPNRRHNRLSLSGRVGAALALLLTPILQLAVNPNLFITASDGAYIDPWVYLGYFLSYPRFLHDFAGKYYGTRLPWLLPGYLAHLVFPPLAANYVLHLGADYAFLFGLYVFVKHGAGRNVALLVVLLAAWDPMTLTAMSWDYVDSAGMVFIVWTMACLENSVDSKHASRWLAGAGASAAAAAGSNLFLVVMWPAFGLFALVRQPRPLRSIPRDAAAALAGAVAILAVLGAINRSAGGDWLFFAPSIQFSRYLLSGPNPWAKSGLLRFTTDFYLALPVAAALSAVWACVSGFPVRNQPDRRFAFATASTVIVAFATWTFFELRGSPVLSTTYYVSYLIPMSLVAIAAQSAWVGLRLETRMALAVLSWGLVVLLAVHGVALSNYRALILPAAPADPVTRDRIATAAALIAGLAAAASLRGLRRPLVRWTVFATCIGLLYALIPIGTFPWPGIKSARSRFELIVDSHRFIDANSTGRDVTIWYGGDAPDLGAARFAIASTFLLGPRLVNERWPALSDEEALRLPGKRLALLLRTPADLDTTIASLSSHGLGTEHMVTQQVGPPDARVLIAVTDLTLERSK